MGNYVGIFMGIFDLPTDHVKPISSWVTFCGYLAGNYMHIDLPCSKVYDRKQRWEASSRNVFKEIVEEKMRLYREK